jgi:hypothetical protein
MRKKSKRIGISCIAIQAASKDILNLLEIPKPGLAAKKIPSSLR